MTLYLSSVLEVFSDNRGNPFDSFFFAFVRQNFPEAKESAEIYHVFL